MNFTEIACLRVSPYLASRGGGGCPVSRCLAVFGFSGLEWGGKEGIPILVMVLQFWFYLSKAYAFRRCDISRGGYPTYD